MLLGQVANSNIYQRAYEQFIGEVAFYAGELKDYVLDLSMPERVLGLCLFILVLIYLIVARARAKYNPGSLGRQFVGAIVVVGIVLIVGDVLFDYTPGAYSGMFRL